MSKMIQYLLIGALIGSAVCGVWILQSFPPYKTAEEAGAFLLGQSVLVGQEVEQGEKMAWELLGCQQYFSVDKVEDEQKMILSENKQMGGVSQSEEVNLDFAADESVETMGTVGAVEKKRNVYVEKLKETLDIKYLWSKFYIVDSTTSVTKDLFDVKKLLDDNVKLAKKSGKKQILIYHTHGASESFSDSSGKTEDSVVGVGTELTKELEKLGYGVYHDKTKYDWIHGSLDRSLAYNKSLEGIEKIRKKYPDIKVLIDLHRDSVGKGRHTYTTINGKKTAIVMFFNGMSRTKSGPIKYLANPNLQGNLAFSLQCKCKAMEYYDGFTKPIYLKGYRYNLHLEKRSLLIELGNENNTVEEAKNAAAPLADVLDKVLSGQG